MEVGDILYYLIFFIVIIGGLVKKLKKQESKKADAPQAQPVYQEKRTTEYDEWYSENEQTYPEKNEVYEKTVPINTYEKDYNASENFYDQKKTDIIGNLNDDEDEKPAFTIELNDVDDVKKAFVYSEVFQRKY
ncbi:hypothetical protein D0T49_10510 [Paludibacter sp. 221]|uniref:hypothetical protein n=1 Tax=Paludibacter sp. 221 TaxID=2302939 RepID=UPI0013D6BC60|nr:hypothetical protein [Paludibacter sp. 221]NDV47478.1 hypothetical protein [Paludibacter sp. 221]